MPFDVLEEASDGLGSADPVEDEGPEMPRIVRTKTASDEGERLARVASADDRNLATILFPREGLEISPERSRLKLPLRHSRKKDFGRAGFDLRISDCAQAWESSSESEVETSVAGAKRDMSEGGSIHVIVTV